jgi:nitroreductase
MLKELLEKRFTAKWWSDKEVEKEKLNYILDCTYLAPSKNGKWNYEIFVLGNSEKANDFKKWSYWEDTYCIDGEQKKEGPIGNRRYNGQILAPVLLVWVSNKKDRETFNDCLVSATISMLAAEEAGLDTGFNGCLSEKDTAKKLDRPGHYSTIMLGLGYADKLDGINNSIQREVTKDGVKHGFDYGNVSPEILRGPNRNKKPEIDNLIHHI